MHYVYLAGAILSEVVATTALKASASFTRPLPSVAVVVGYGAAFVLLSVGLMAPVQLSAFGDHCARWYKTYRNPGGAS